MPAPLDPLALCLVGAGPRSLGVLERLGAHAAQSGRHVVVHVVDPHPAGSGRIWRSDQHPLLWMNSRAADVTVLPDETSTLLAPARGGPTLHGWLAEHRTELAARFAAEGAEELHREVLGVQEGSFASRALGSHYLRWAWQEVLDTLPAHVSVVEHQTHVLDVIDAAGSPRKQHVQLARGRTLEVDAVVLAQGHPDVAPGPRERELQGFADRQGLRYVAPAHTSDLGLPDDLDTLRPGEDAVVAGMGLAFVDLVVLVAEGRGGRFTEDADGTLRYAPSGREPLLHVGSRRGVPYRSKITYELARRPALPRFFTADIATGIATTRGGELSLRDDVWPLVAKELAGAHYAELFRSHPERTTVAWEQFDARFAGAAWGSADLDDLVAGAVPDEQDRLDLIRLDRPLDGWWGGSAEEVHDRVRDHVAGDVVRRGNPEHSADAAVFFALLSCYVTVADLTLRGLLDARSAAIDVDGWWHGLFSYLASGPPPQRLRQLIALADAGVVRFLGGDLVVTADEERGVWAASTANSPGEVTARVLVDARLPSPSIRSSSDPLLRNLFRRGEVREQSFGDPRTDSGLTNGRLVVDADHRLVGADGAPHPRRFAVGPWVAGTGWASAFARPRLNAGFFRLNDRVAAALLAAGDDPGRVTVVVPRAARTARSAGTPRVG